MITAFVETMLDVLFTGTGRRLLGLFGWRPHETVLMFAGMGFWIAVGMLAYRVLH